MAPFGRTIRAIGPYQLLVRPSFIFNQSKCQYSSTPDCWLGCVYPRAYMKQESNLLSLPSLGFSLIKAFLAK